METKTRPKTTTTTTTTTKNEKDEKDISKILGDVINKQHEVENESDISEEFIDEHQRMVDETSVDPAKEQRRYERRKFNKQQNKEIEEGERRITERFAESQQQRSDLNKHYVLGSTEADFDLPFHPGEILDEINSPVAMEKIGKMMGLEGAPNIRFMTAEDPPAPEFNSIVESEHEDEENLGNYEIPQLEGKAAQLYKEGILYSGTRRENAQINAIEKAEQTRQANKFLTGNTSDNENENEQGSRKENESESENDEHQEYESEEIDENPKKVRVSNSSYERGVDSDLVRYEKATKKRYDLKYNKKIKSLTQDMHDIVTENIENADRMANVSDDSDNKVPYEADSDDFFVEQNSNNNNNENQDNESEYESESEVDSESDDNADDLERGELFDAAINQAGYIMDHNVETIFSHQEERGKNHGKLLYYLSRHPDELMEQKPELDDVMNDVISKKCEKDSQFLEKHKKFQIEFDDLSYKLQESTDKYGDDHELTLKIQNQMDKLGKNHLRNFSLNDFDEFNELDFLRIPDDLPIQKEYQGVDGELKLKSDIRNKSLQLAPIIDYDRYIYPKASQPYFQGVEMGVANDCPKEAEKLSFHAFNRVDSYHHTIYDAAVSDIVDSLPWESVQETMTLPIPSTLPEFLRTRDIVGDYYVHTNEFRDHLENFIVTRLTKEISDMKKDTQEFTDLAQQFDKRRLKKQKNNQQRAFVMERAKQRAIDNGTFRPPTVSIITKALSRKGFTDKEDIIDQALEFLRRDGHTYTHKDIPPSRMDNFNQKFRAIFFNGSLKPLDKARMVATTISSFIVSTDELKIAGHGYKILENQLTEYEQSEKSAASAAVEDNMTMNLDSATMSINHEKIKRKFEQVKENEVSWEGYNTSDFEEDEKPDLSIPKEFDRLSKFKPHADYHAKLAAYAGDEEEFNKRVKATGPVQDDTDVLSEESEVESEDEWADLSSDSE